MSKPIYKKTYREVELFVLKYAFWMRQRGIIPDSVLQEYKKDAAKIKASKEYRTLKAIE